MDKDKFLGARKTLGKTQKQLAALLGISLKAIHSYEQGWRNVPGHVERQMLFLVSRKKRNHTEPKPCWVIKNCPPECKDHCPAWEFQTGDLCWFINGTICGGVAQKNWHEKMKICRSCEVLTSLIEPYSE